MRTALAALAFVTATATVARADPSPAPAWTVRGFEVDRWAGTSSQVALATAPLAGGGVAVERRVVGIGLPGPFPVLDVTAEVGFEAASADGTTFDQLHNTIGTWDLTAGARARLPLLPWLHLQARGAVGGARSSVKISGPTMDGAVADAGNAMVAAAGVGLALLPRLTPRTRGAFHLGVELEVGYQTTTAWTVHATPEHRPPAELTIPARYAALGDLDLDGWTMRLGVTIGF